jgi:hypothetical protein
MVCKHCTASLWLSIHKPVGIPGAHAGYLHHHSMRPAALRHAKQAPHQQRLEARFTRLYRSPIDSSGAEAGFRYVHPMYKSLPPGTMHTAPMLKPRSRSIVCNLESLSSLGLAVLVLGAEMLYPQNSTGCPKAQNALKVPKVAASSSNDKSSHSLAHTRSSSRFGRAAGKQQPILDPVRMMVFRLQCGPPFLGMHLDNTH